MNSAWPWRQGAALLVMLGALYACGPPSTEQLLASAKSDLQNSQLNQAVVQLKAVLQQKPQSAEARFLLGRALFGLGDRTAAAVEFEKAAELKYPESEVIPLLARVMLVPGQAKKVTDRFEKTSLDDAHAFSDLKSTLAGAFAARDMAERAEVLVTESLQLNPRNPVARLLQARMTARQGQVDAALQQLDALLVDSPKQYEAWHFKGDLIRAAKRDLPGAALAFEKALEAEPRYLPAHTSLVGMALLRRDMAAFDLQVQAMKKVLPGAFDTRFYEAQGALIRKDFKGAREITQQMLKLAPDNARLLQLSGAVELNTGSLVLAVTHLTQAIQLEPRLLHARHLLAQAHLRGGEPARALAVLQPVLAQKNPLGESLALAAAAYLQNGQLAQAEMLFGRAATLTPDDPRVRTALAMSQIAKGNEQAGFAALEVSADQDKGTFADMALVSARLRKNDLDGALSAVERLQRKLPKDALPYQIKGDIALRNKDAAAAQSNYEKALAEDPAYFPAVASLARLDVAAKKLDAATVRLEKYLAKEPGSVNALVMLIELKKRQGANSDSLLEMIAKAAKANAADPAPRLLQVEFLLSRNDSSAARNVAQEASTVFPDDIRVLDALGRSQMASGDVQQAVSTFGKVVAAQPAAVQSHLRLAEAHRLNKDPASAAKSLLRALEVDSKLLPAQIGLIQLALEGKRANDALTIAGTIQTQRPAEAVGYLLEADVQSVLKAWGPAVAAVRSALEREKSPTSAVRLHALLETSGKSKEADALASTWLKERPKDRVLRLHLGAFAMEKKQYGLAEEQFRTVVTMHANDITALNNLALAIAAQGKPGGVEFAERAVKLAPKLPSVMDTMASALSAEGQVVKALEWQRKAIAAAAELTPPAYRIQLAKLLVKSGDKAAARVELEKLAYLGDKLPQQAEVAELLKSLQ